MKRLPKQILAGAVLGPLWLTAACSQPAPKQASPVSEAPAKPAAPPEMAQAAASDLGQDAEVLAFGDLAHDGRPQVLAVNRLAKAPTGTVPGLLVTRAVVLEKDSSAWKEIFRADEHLKNPSGYLGGTPISPVPSWRLQFEQHADVGLVMYFTPLQPPAGGYAVTIGVRWNPKVMRYQALDRKFESFLGEVPSLEKVQFEFHR